VKILLCSVPFKPSVGGIETVSALLAEWFARAGHRVTVVTQTESLDDDVDAFEVVRRPSALRLLSLVRWADVVFHNNISLRLAWPLLLVSRPWVVAHHTWIPAAGFAGRAKHRTLRHACNIAVSRAVAASLPVSCEVIGNPYADDVFYALPGRNRKKELLFVGRLVSDKGVSVLLAALGELAKRGVRPKLTVVGDGPEAPVLRRLCESLDIEPQVTFSGWRSSAQLARLFRAHRMLLVPSVWEEPFGIVALEALACGCVPVVARSGGLPEAVGPCGVVLPRGDVKAWADGLQRLLRTSTLLDELLGHAPAHLERHTRDRVAQAYLEVLGHAQRTRAAPGAARAA
jgi:glycosyltransferase involved in cell wall biosynthesis